MNTNVYNLFAVHCLHVKYGRLITNVFFFAFYFCYYANRWTQANPANTTKLLLAWDFPFKLTSAFVLSGSCGSGLSASNRIQPEVHVLVGVCKAEQTELINLNSFLNEVVGCITQTCYSPDLNEIKSLRDKRSRHWLSCPTLNLLLSKTFSWTESWTCVTVT